MLNVLLQLSGLFLAHEPRHVHPLHILTRPRASFVENRVHICEFSFCFRAPPWRSPSVCCRSYIRNVNKLREKATDGFAHVKFSFLCHIVSSSFLKRRQDFRDRLCSCCSLADTNTENILLKTPERCQKCDAKNKFECSFLFRRPRLSQETGYF